MPLDAPALRKKSSHTCSKGLRAVLSSLLMYVSDRADGPQRAADTGHPVGCWPQSREAGRRPTHFQLLQAKFMGTGREHHLKRTREVGRLISKDKQGPGRSLVSATINKLLEKTKEGASSPGQRTLAGEKPRWAPPSGKSTVKNILKKFLAAEEKEKKEKEAGEKPPSRQPGATRGLLPRIVGRSTILSKLRERFEQSSCLHSEASLLPLHREGRKSLQKKLHRPELRVLHTATMATSCTRTPPAHFLACTAEPLPALSIATVVCSPRSWLSHCSKISHLDSRRRPRRDTSISLDSGDTEPSRDTLPGVGPPSEEPRGQPKPSKSPMPQMATPGDSHLALNTTEGIPQQDSPWASWEALPDSLPLLSPLRPASPRGPGPAGGDRTVESTAEGPTGHVWGLKENGTGEVPDVTMTVCSSEDEVAGAPPASDREPLFATQRNLPEQGPAAQIPPLAAPPVQAARRAQPALECPQISLRLPVVHEMPAPPGPQQSAWPGEDRRPGAAGGHAAGARAGAELRTVTEAREDCPASGRLSPSCRAPASPGASSQQGSPEALRATAPTGPESTPGGKGDKHSLGSATEGGNHRTGSGWSVPELSCQQHPLPELNDTPMPKLRPSPHQSTQESHPGGGPCSTSGSQPKPEPPEGGAAADPAWGFRGPESRAASDRRGSCGQKERKGPPAEPAPPLGTAGGDAGCDSSENRLPPLEASRATAPGGKVPSPTGDRRAPGGTQAPEDRTAPTGSDRDPENRKALPRGAQVPEDRMAQPGGARVPKDRTAPPLGSTWAPEDKTAPLLGSTWAPEDRTAPRLGSTWAPEDGMMRPRGTQDPESRTAPLGAGGAAEDLAGQERTTLDAEERPVPTAPHYAAEGCGLLGESRALDPGRHFLAPAGSSQHKSRAAEESACEDRAGQLPPAGVPPMAVPEETSGPCLGLPEPGLRVAQDSAAAGTGTPLGRAVGGGAQPGGTASRVQPASRPTPHRSPAGSLALGQAQWPSADQQAQGRGGLQPAAHTFPGAARAPACLPGPAPEQRPAHRRAAHKAGGLGPLQVGEGKPESLLSPEGSVTGHERSHQTQEPDGNTGAAARGEKAEAHVAWPQAQAAQDAPGAQKAAAMEKPCQPRARGQESPPGPAGKQVRSPAQEGGPKADRSPAAPSGTPGGSCSLAAEGHRDGLQWAQGQTSGRVPQAWGQPDSPADRAPTSGACGESWGPTHRVSGQGSLGAPRPTWGSQPLAGKSAAASLAGPAESFAQPTPDAGGCPTPPPPAQEGLPNSPRAERDLSEGEHHRRSVHFAKYKAQSFSDQRAFDLSFRPTLLRASDTFEAPK